MVTRPIRPLASSQYLITIQGVTLKATKFAGGAVKRETTEYVDPNTRRKQSVRGIGMVENITITYNYHPETCKPLADLKKQFETAQIEDVTVTVQGIKDDPNQTAIGAPRTYYGCQMISYKLPDADLSGSDASELEIEFTVDELVEA